VLVFGVLIVEVNLELKQKAEENMRGLDTKLFCICKHHCQTEQFKKEFDITKLHRNAFRNGYFRCRKCEYYIKGFNYCPCCGTRLARAPRNARSKRKLNVDIVRY
jgi:rubrerythrin